MPKRVTPSQFRSLVRQAEQRQRQAINSYNSAARKHNSEVRRAVNDYNREVRAHNSRVRVNRRRLRSELARLSSRTTTTRFVSYRSSVVVLHQSFARIEAAAEHGDWREGDSDLFDLAEGEAANSVAVLNALEGVADSPAADGQSLQSSILTELKTFSADLDRRWTGALFALSPRNPDAARHFCTSSREILSAILDAEAPMDDVLAAYPEAPRTPDGWPTRRDRIRYCLARRGRESDGFAEFVDADIQNVVDLFQVFNDGTHGTAGRFDLSELLAVKNRVEQAVRFLYAVVR